MTVERRLERLEGRAAVGRGGGFSVGVQVGDQVRIGDQVMTLAQWEDLEGHKILVTRREEEEV